MHIDNSAFYLAAHYLLKVVKSNGDFDVEGFRAAVNIMILAQEIIVGYSSYPTPTITQNALDYRELGLGYANLGALLMNLGLPYDSDGGRNIAGMLTSILSGEAYATSAKIAAQQGTFAGYPLNREPMLNVIRMHYRAAEDLTNKFLAA